MPFSGGTDPTNPLNNRVAMLLGADYKTVVGSSPGVQQTALQLIGPTYPATITATGAATAVTLIEDNAVGAGRKVKVLGVYLTVTGATAWSGGSGTILTIQDSNGTPVAFVEFAVAQLTGNAYLVLGSTGVTAKAGLLSQAGGTSGKGLVIKGDAAFGAGSNISVSVMAALVPA